MKPFLRPSARRRRGAALLTALIALMFLLIVGGSMLTVTSGALQMAGHQRDRLQAFNLAESGVDRGARWLKEQGYPPTATTDPFGGAVSFGEGTYQVTVTPDAGNSSSGLKHFTVSGVGTVRGRSVSVEMVLRQSSFGRYAYFTDKEISSVSGGPIWFMSRDRIRGPAHSNNRDDSSGNPTNFRINWQGATESIFKDIVTAAGSSITYSPYAPTTEAQFLQIYQSGSRGYRLGVDPIPLPSSTDAQKNAAWGAQSGFPTTTGAYAGGNPADGAPISGGIYIVGNCTITMQRDASGNQQFVIVQSTGTTTFTFDLVNNVTRRSVNGGTPTSHPGVGTGVIYCTGNITALSGEVADNYHDADSIIRRSAYTIATDVNGGKSITITNNVRYHTQPDPTKPRTDASNLNAGTLGLFARNVIVASSAPQNLTINGVILAGSESVSDGSFYVSNYNTKTPTGTLTLLGGIIQKARGPVGTFNSSTGTMSTGYAKDYYYDPRLADSPPPYFPTTGNYERIAWKRSAE